MNIKAYIDFFSEIAERDRSQQFSLLERAENNANKRFSMPIFKVIAVLVPSTIVLLFVSLGYFLWAFPKWSIVVMIILGLLVSRVIISELNGRLLHTGLINILDQHDT